MKKRKGKYQRFYSIPIPLLTYTLSNALFGELRVYLFLKSKTHRTIELTPKLKKDIGERLGYKIRSVEIKLKKLRELQWIGYNLKAKIIHLRGFDRIRQLIGGENRKALKFDMHIIKHLDKVKAFCLVGGISVLAYQQHKKQVQLWRLRNEIPKQQQGRPELYPSFNQHYPIALRVIEQRYNRSKDWVAKYKRIAQDNKFIDCIQPKPIPITDAKGEKIPISELLFYYAANGEMQGRIINRHGYLYERQTGLIRIMCNKRKNEKIILANRSKYER